MSDVDAGSAPITTTLSVSHGTLTVTSVGSGATIQDSGTGMVTLTGSVSQIDDIFNASNKVIYTPAANWFGSDTLTMVTDDGGNTGTGGPLSDTKTVAITVDFGQRRAERRRQHRHDQGGHGLYVRGRRFRLQRCERRAGPAAPIRSPP